MTGTDTFAPPPSPDDPWGGDASPLDPPPPFAPPRPRRRRRGPIIAIVGGLALLAVAGGIGWDVTSTARERATEPAQRGDTGDLNGVQVVAGMCLADVDPDATTVGRVTAVPCGEPHRAEAIAAYVFPESPWPGSERVARGATDFCAVQVGRAFDAVDVDVDADWTVWTPSQDTWAAGDRSALCIVTSTTDLTGSFEEGTVAPAPANAA